MGWDVKNQTKQLRDCTVPFYCSPGKHSSITTTSTDDEHRLIARYAARLAADVKNAVSNSNIVSVFLLSFV